MFIRTIQYCFEMEPYKKDTTASYDIDPLFFEKKFRESFEQFGRDEATLFISKLFGKKVLDIGCGPGIYLDFFRENGLDAVGIDISDKFLETCFKKGLNVRKMDMENILFWPYSFDGIWAGSVLLHLQRKRIPALVKSWAKLLKPSGIIWVLVKEGEREGFDLSEREDNSKRWFTYFTENELREYFSPFFNEEYFYRRDSGNGVIWLEFLFRLKPDLNQTK